MGLYGTLHGKRNKIAENLLEAQTLDECCIEMRKTTWERFKFNEVVCDNWHLYAVELCLRAGEQNVLIASGSFNIKHLSYGNVDKRYMKTFKELLVIHKKKKWVATTCKTMPTNLVIFYLYYGIWNVKKAMFGNYPMAYRIKKLL